jgi:hypothetical protein
MPSRAEALAAARLGVALACLTAPGLATAQEPPPPAASTPSWSGAASMAVYFVPDDVNYVQPTIEADRGWLHLEARYNYEALRTASFWVGANVEFGEKVTLALTPMFGVVTGDTDGVAPGLKATLSFWKMELYGESEWVVDADDRADNFFYMWSEVTVQPVEWMRVGMVTQRTRAYQSERDIQRGILAGVLWKNASLTGHVFEPFSDAPTTVVSLSIAF